MPDVWFQPFGAARTVTGSRHVIHAGRHSILLDCGLHQGPRREAEERNRHLPFPHEIDAVLLSHAHIDHSGALPALTRSGFGGRVHSTAATRDLCRSMLLDSAHLQEADARYLNKRRERGRPPIRPLYTAEDVAETLRGFRTHPLDEPFQVVEGIRATFREAGHILGSAGILVEITDGPRIYFTGDLGRRAYPILEDPAPLPRADVILSECTYGTREHGTVEGAEETTLQVLRRAVEVDGRVFVPAFSVGRTQNLVYGLAQLRQRGLIPDIPVFVDSPLALQATRAFVEHPECYDAEIKAFIGDGGRPFLPENVQYIENRVDSKALNAREGPFVVIAGSGMCEGGRILHHLLHGIEDPRNTILFVGYAAPSTLARRIMDGDRRVRVLGQWLNVEAQIARIDAYSAHADGPALRRYLAPAKAWGSTIYLVHGDEDVALDFAEILRKDGHGDVVVPETFARYRLGAKPRVP